MTQFKNESEAVIKCYDLAVTRYSLSINLIHLSEAGNSPLTAELRLLQCKLIINFPCASTIEPILNVHTFISIYQTDGVSSVLKTNANKYIYSISGIALLLTKSSKTDVTG